MHRHQTPPSYVVGDTHGTTIVWSHIFFGYIFLLTWLCDLKSLLPAHKSEHARMSCSLVLVIAVIANSSFGGFDALVGLTMHLVTKPVAFLAHH